MKMMAMMIQIWQVRELQAEARERSETIASERALAAREKAEAEAEARSLNRQLEAHERDLAGTKAELGAEREARSRQPSESKQALAAAYQENTDASVAAAADRKGLLAQLASAQV